MFLDHVRLTVRAGDGGRGAISFRREAHVPRGGPDGGDGGSGGDLVLRVDPQMTTLSEFRFKRTFAATAGGAGARANRRGRNGSDLVLRVPAGTIVRDLATGAIVADLAASGDEIVVAEGGGGGRGNARFATSTRRAPRIAEDGGSGGSREIELELKLIADVGLLGMPNAGKSSLLAALTRARPKIAAYPFTTLTPNLGVLRTDDRELVLADIPGLIEGAHGGAGLGEEFLRHIERTRLLVHVIDAARPDPPGDIRVIDGELGAYGRGLLERPRLFALNKIDLAEARDAVPGLRSALQGRDAVAISAATGEGMADLMRAILAACPPAPVPEPAAPRERRIAFARTASDWEVVPDDGGFRVRGDRIERLASGIDWDSPDAAAYFQQLLVRSGIERELRHLGVREGDTVRVGRVELEWREGGSDGS